MSTCVCVCVGAGIVYCQAFFFLGIPNKPVVVFAGEEWTEVLLSLQRADSLQHLSRRVLSDKHSAGV